MSPIEFPSFDKLFRISRDAGAARISKTTDMKKATKITGTCSSFQIISICPNIVSQISQGQIPQSHVWFSGLKPNQQRYPRLRMQFWDALKRDYKLWWLASWEKKSHRTSLHRIKRSKLMNSNHWKTDLFCYGSTWRVSPTFLGWLTEIRMYCTSFLSYINNLCISYII